MMKRFLNSIMILSALFIVAGGLITSCKDYDDDINNLQQGLTAQEQNLKKLSEETETAIKGLQTRIKALEDKNVEILKSIDDNKKEIEKNKAAIDKNSGDIAANLAKIQANEEKIAKALVRIKANEDAIASLKTKVQALREELDVIKTKDIPELQEAVKKINEHLDELDTFVENQGKKNEEFEKNITDLQTAVAKAATKEELEAAIKDFNDKMSALDTKFDGLISTLRADMDQKFADQKADYDKQIKDLRDEYKKALENYPTKEELQAELNTIRNSINTLAGRVAALEKNSATKQELADAITELKEGVIKDIQNDVDNLETNLENLEELTYDLSDAFSQIIEERVTSIEYIPEDHFVGVPSCELNNVVYSKWEKVGTDDEALVISGTSSIPEFTLTQPKETVIKFNLNPHSAALSLDATLDNVGLEWIKSKNSFDILDAKPLKLKKEEAPLEINDINITDDGILEVTLIPNPEFKEISPVPHPDKPEIYFYMFRIILRQDIVVTDTEEFVTPDEYVETRSEYILLNNKNVKILKLHSLIPQDEATPKDEDEDFVGLHEILDPSTELPIEESVLIEQLYRNEPLDLNKLVNVRLVGVNLETGEVESVATGNDYVSVEDLDKYGLSIEYKILSDTAPLSYHPKVLENIEPAALPDAPTTNSYYFAEYNTGSITNKHFLTAESIAYTFTPIGHTPVVQILLKKDKDIIDVRYLPVRFIDWNCYIDGGKRYVTDYNGIATSFGYPVDFKDNILPLMHKNLHLDKYFQTTKQIATTYYFKGAKAGNVYKPNLYSIDDSGINLITDGSSMSLTETDDNIAGNWTAKIPTTHPSIVEAIANGEDHALVTSYIELTPKFSPIFKKTHVLISHTIKVIFKKVTLNDEIGYFAPYWKGELSAENKEKEFLINPAIISDSELGSAHFATCQIVGNILNGYQKNGSVVTDVAELASAPECKKVRFIFDLDNLKGPEGLPLEHPENFVEIVQQSNHQILRTKSGKIEIATLYENGELQLAETPDYGEGNSYGTTAAKELLGNNVTLPVKVEANLFGDLKYDIDNFQVRFVKPLDIKFNKTQLPDFEDFVAGGSTIAVADIVTVKEAFGSNTAVVYENGTLDSTLGPWYNVSIPTWDLDGAKCNLKLVDGNIEVVDQVTSNFSDFSDWFTLTKNAAETELTFHNNHGTALQKDITLKIPVSVKTKWGYYTHSSSMMTVKAKVGK